MDSQETMINCGQAHSCLTSVALTFSVLYMKIVVLHCRCLKVDVNPLNLTKISYTVKFYHVNVISKLFFYIKSFITMIPDDTHIKGLVKELPVIE